MMSSKDKQALELHKEISKYQEETMRLWHEKERLIKTCEFLEKKNEEVESKRRLQLIEPSLREKELKLLRKNLEREEQTESRGKASIIERQASQEKVKESLEEEVNKIIYMLEQRRQEVRAQSEILASFENSSADGVKEINETK